jgi:hypothetical protein
MARCIMRAVSRALVPFKGTRRFDIHAKLGAGGMGVVYLARDRERDEDVALKTIKTLDADALARFKNEFRALQGVVHPNLVQLRELIEEGGQWFFTMEYVPGEDWLSYVRPSAAPSGPVTESLVSRIDPLGATSADPSGSRPIARGLAPHEGGGLEEARLRRTLVQIARGLFALHRAGKVHRDVKPSNLRVTPDGHAVVLDFGLVDDVGVRERVGTFGYVAPEQAAGLPATPASDWYSVGVMLHEALGGEGPNPLGGPADLVALAKALLRAEPKHRPTGLEVLECLCERRAPRERPRTVSAPPHALFVGRGPELRALAQAFDRASAGGSAAVLLRGPSGIGKSTLVHRFLEQRSFAHVLEGRCLERESVPYKAFDRIFDTFARRLRAASFAERARLAPRAEMRLLVRAFPVLQDVVAGEDRADDERELATAHEQRSLLFDEAKRLFTRIATHGENAAIVVLDDLQWADADSVTMLEHLLRAPGVPRTLFLLTARPTLAVLPAAAQEIAVEPLGPREAAALARAVVEERGGEFDATRATTALDGARGMPFDVLEIAREMASGPAPTEDLPSASDLLRARIDKQPPDARLLLALVSASGGRLPARILARASGVPDLARSALQLRMAGLLKPAFVDGWEAFEPSHDRVRETALTLLDARNLESLHRSLAEALEAFSGAAEQLAVHWAGAGELAKALPHARRAASEADRALAFERAARLWRMVRSLHVELGGTATAGIDVKLAAALSRAGRGAEAAEAYLRAAEHRDADADAHVLDAFELRRLAAEHLLHSGRFDDGAAVLRALLREVGVELPATTRGALFGFLAGRGYLVLRGYDFREAPAPDAALARKVDVVAAASRGLGMFDNMRGAHVQTLHMRLALSLGDPGRLGRAFAAEAPFVAAEGRREVASRLVAIAMALGERTGDEHVKAMATFGAGFSALQGGRFLAGHRLLDAADRALRESSHEEAWERTVAVVSSTWCLSYMGDMTELVRRVEARLRSANERGDLACAANLRVGMPALGWLAEGDVARLRAETELALASWSKNGYQAPHCFALLARAYADLYEGDAAAAVARLDAEWRDLDRSMFLRNQLIRVTMTALRATARLGLGREEDLRFAMRTAKRLSREGVTWAVAFSELILAGVALRRSDPLDARARLAAASLAFDDAEMWLHRAVADHCRATLQGGAEGDRARETTARQIAAAGVSDVPSWVRMIAPFTSHPQVA